MDFIVGGTGGYYDDPIYLKLPTFHKNWQFYTLDDLKNMNCKTLSAFWTKNVEEAYYEKWSYTLGWYTIINYYDGTRHCPMDGADPMWNNDTSDISD